MPTINSLFYIKSSDSPIFKESYESLKRILKRIWGKDIEVYGSVQDSDVDREAVRVSQSYVNPYFVLRPSSLEDNTNSYNGFTLKKFGATPIQHENGYFYSFHLRPCKMLCSVQFYCSSLSEVLDFCSNWHFNSREFTFSLDVGGFNVDIRVEVEPTINVPSKDLSTVNPFKVEANLTLYTYTGSVYKSPQLKGIDNQMYLVKNVTIPEWVEINKKDPNAANQYLVKP